MLSGFWDVAMNHAVCVRIAEAIRTPWRNDFFGRPLALGGLAELGTS